MRSCQRGLLILFTAGCLSACAPGLGRDIGVSPISMPSGESPRSNSSVAVHAQIRPFVDNRPSQAIAEIGGREINSRGDLALQVREAFENYLKQRGVETGDPEAPIIGGQISAWYVRVEPGFPTSQAQAEATLVIEVSNLANQLVYTGKYSGSTVVSHPMLNESRISDALAQAMGYAIEEALRDEKLMDRIARTYHPIF